LKIEAESQRLYSSSTYSLTASPPVPGYTSIRTFNILCWGALALLQRYPNCDKQFRHGEHLLIFDSVLEAKRATSRYRKRPEARARIRQAAWALAAKKHTMTHRILNIMANALDVDGAYWGHL
jgi:spore maturation protein CgeB